MLLAIVPAPDVVGSSWVDLKFGDLQFVQFCSDKWKSDRYPVIRQVLARFFFHQLISGISYYHAMKICHKDLNMENTLLDGSPTLCVKICDFGYSKSGLLHSQPKSTVGTLAYIASEVLSRKEYDGKVLSFYFSFDFVSSSKHLVRIADGSMETFMHINK
ncbi:hypothetical protein Patl1_32388 [Pistacia atlantica]|uniref:Uncharacterized protein n=1 Tax=Pistacia atlantica TaxID=434234 RepID=A0ACC1AQJ4_9ROSI|nr:hypothetical protein Patl1_32388 [Pistacia atlantica]